MTGKRLIIILAILLFGGAALAVRQGGAGSSGADTHPGALVVTGAITGGNEYSKSITVESPTAAEDLTFFFTNKAITITEMRCVLIGGGAASVDWTVRHHATDRTNAGNEVVTGGTTTASTTAGSDVTAFDDATIPADSFVWLETTASADTTELALTVVYTRD